MASLRELFTELAGAGPGGAEPAELLRAHGFELSAEEAAQALVSFAYSAPVAVAEHLQQYVMVHAPVPAEVTASESGDDGLQLLAAMPAEDELTGLGSDPAEGLDHPALDHPALADEVPAGLDSLGSVPPGEPHLDGGMAADLGFGGGGGAGSAASLASGPAESPSPPPDLGMDLSPEPSWLADPVPPSEPVTPVDPAAPAPDADPADEWS